MEYTSNKSVSVIVVTRGVGDYLAECLSSLKRQKRPPEEIFLIDNSEKIDFAKNVLRDHPDIHILSSGTNLFYCQALNKGIEASHGGFILCLNDDVILDDAFLGNALEAFSYSPDIGMVSGKVLRRDGVTLDSTGLFLTLWRTARERGYGRKDRGQFQEKGYCFGVNGAVAFYRRDMLDQIKEKGVYFDPDFHIFYEDLDIAWRAQRRGWKGYYFPQAVAYHLRGGTVRLRGGISKPHARRYLSDMLHADLIKNRYLAVIKNESILGFLCHLPFTAIYDAAMWGYILFFCPRQIKYFVSNMKYLQSALTPGKC